MLYETFEDKNKNNSLQSFNSDASILDEKYCTETKKIFIICFDTSKLVVNFSCLINVSMMTVLTNAYVKQGSVVIVLMAPKNALIQQQVDRIFES